jgi:hypothetical protein
VFLRLESERVTVDTGAWDTGVMLIRLDKIEVSSVSDRETVVSVK